MIVVSEVLAIQRAGDGRVAELVIGGAGGLDGQLRGPLGGQGGPGGGGTLTPVIPGVIVNEHRLLLGAGHVTRVPGATGHVVVMGAEVFRTDGVTRTGGHLDRGHDGAHVVMMRTQLTPVIMRRLLGLWVLVTMVTLAPDWADDPVSPLGHGVGHGGHRAAGHLPGGAHLGVLG